MQQHARHSQPRSHGRKSSRNLGTLTTALLLYLQHACPSFHVPLLRPHLLSDPIHRSRITSHHISSAQPIPSQLRNRKEQMEVDHARHPPPLTHLRCRPGPPAAAVEEEVHRYIHKQRERCFCSASILRIPIGDFWIDMHTYTSPPTSRARATDGRPPPLTMDGSAVCGGCGRV